MYVCKPMYKYTHKQIMHTKLCACMHTIRICICKYKNAYTHA